MRIQTVSSVAEINPVLFNGQSVIVIDVLRASSTIVTALDSGFASVFPVVTANEAYALRSEDTVLAGEWHCEKINGFDYNNSPTVISKKQHAGKQLVLTTTNGTKAVEKAMNAERLLIGCFLNATACVKKAIDQNVDITIYCAGTRNEFALEDGLAAGMMVNIAKKQNPSIETCDFSGALEACFLQLAHRLQSVLPTTTTGKRLVNHGYIEDIQYCCQTDVTQIVPIINKERIFTL